jgi:hypothetical protein
MAMQAFHDIESLRHVCERLKSNYEFHGIAGRPTIKFRGTCKLHGTNAGVAVNGTSVTAQGRNRELTITSDNYGFAHFVSGRTDDFRMLASIATGSITDVVTIYGEWCGQGIQKKVAIASLPKMLVVFAVFNHTTDEWVDIHSVSPAGDELNHLNATNIYLITQAKTYEVDIDFNDPNPAAELISQYTLQVEDVCPFSGMLGVEGMGEGIVWISEGYKERLTFKSKGEKHKKGGEKTQVAVDPEKVASISALVDLLLPEWRLEQGFSYMRENNIPFANTSTGEYLKWIAKDVLKEESDRIAANPFPWKELQGTIMVRAREYFLNELNVMSGLAVAS